MELRTGGEGTSSTDCVLLSGDEAPRCRNSTEVGGGHHCFRETCESAPSQKNAVPSQTSQVSLTKLPSRKAGTTRHPAQTLSRAPASKLIERDSALARRKSD